MMPRPNRWKQASGKSLAALLALLFAWVVTVCIVPQPSHACCKAPMSKQAKADMPCCSIKAATQTISREPQQPLQPEPIIPVHHVEAGLHFSPVIAELNQSLTASAWTPDQSGRYLELRVLLN